MILYSKYTISDFEVAQGHFLCYLNEWKVSVQDRVGISKSERNRMLLSDATQLGLEMTCE